MNVRLLVLGLLQRQPMHGYELRRVAVESRIESWSGILPGSIYHALKKLEQEGLVAPAKARRGAERPRAVYSITAAGRRALSGLVREALSQPIRPFPTDLYGGLVYLDALPDDEVTEIMERQIAALEAGIAAWTSAKVKKAPLAPETEALFDSGIEHMRVDLRVLQRLRGRKPSRSRK